MKKINRTIRRVGKRATDIGIGITAEVAEYALAVAATPIYVGCVVYDIASGHKGQRTRRKFNALKRDVK